MKEVEFIKMELKNVLTPDGERNITVQIVPFNRRNDAHVEFAFAYGDMCGRAPSEFRNMSDAAKRFAELFIVHKADDLKDANSDISCVLHDVRACRTAFLNPDVQKQLNDFFDYA